MVAIKAAEKSAHPIGWKGKQVKHKMSNSRETRRQHKTSLKGVCPSTVSADRIHILLDQRKIKVFIFLCNWHLGGWGISIFKTSTYSKELDYWERPTGKSTHTWPEPKYLSTDYCEIAFKGNSYKFTIYVS